MTSPLQLEHGLWLEGPRVLIPWLTPRSALMTRGAPKVEIAGPSIDLTWDGPGFGGLDGVFKTHLGDGATTGPASWYAADRLTYWDFTFYASNLDERAKFEHLARLFREHIGVGVAWSEQGLPTILWEHAGYSLGLALAERFDSPYCSLRISHASNRHMTLARHGPRT